MVPDSQRGQALIELIVICLFFVWFVLLTASLGESTMKSQESSRFMDRKFRPKGG